MVEGFVRVYAKAWWEVLRTCPFFFRGCESASLVCIRARVRHSHMALVGLSAGGVVVRCTKTVCLYRNDYMHMSKRRV